MSEFRLRLEGDLAHLGNVPARDVALLLLNAEKVVKRAAAAVVGRPKTSVGRYEGVLDTAGSFVLKAIESASVAVTLDVPEMSRDELALDVEAPTLTEAAIVQLIDAAKGESRTLPGVAAALLDFTEALRIGDRYDACTLDLRSTRTQSRTAILNRAVRDRLRLVAAAHEPSIKEDTVTGVLVEADFEKNTARLRSPENPALTVIFDAVMADEIQDALRQRATLEGLIVYDAGSLMVKSVRLRQVIRNDQLVLGIDPDAFWRARSFGDLVDAQEGGAPVSPEQLQHHGASEAELDAFLAAIGDPAL